MFDMERRPWSIICKRSCSPSTEICKISPMVKIYIYFMQVYVYMAKWYDGKQTSSYLKMVGLARFENRKKIMRPCIFLGWLFLLLLSFLLFLWIDTIAIEPYGSWLVAVLFQFFFFDGFYGMFSLALPYGSNR